MSGTVRDLDGARLRVRPDRASCTSSGATHVLLNAALLARRSATARVIGTALTRAAGGQSHRRIAEALNTPVATVRGRVRCARATAVELWQLGVQAVVAFDRDALPTVDRADPLAALDVLVAAAAAARRRFGHAVGPPWTAITVLTRGRLLARAPTG
ncbi:helix-turn-helix domain-containing protein [Amycolatopsis sp. WAC 04182]|uniref:helix-turn-helix domain-containing protein n=1 Tax=Amycolatopsis sp. WAC 04182 TaxID=2203198 RepID=UPI000F7A1215|nr:helix-turn-helix domain-containing protein [Amycolatopsis sp. WAC 04182]